MNEVLLKTLCETAKKELKDREGRKKGRLGKYKYKPQNFFIDS